MNATINHEQHLFVIPSGGGCSCLGFDKSFDEASQLADRLHARREVHQTNQSDLQKGDRVTYKDISLRSYRGTVTEIGKPYLKVRWDNLLTDVDEWAPNLMKAEA